MPLPGQVAVDERVKVQARTQSKLRTQLEEKRNLTKPDSPNQFKPSVPDWLQVSHPLDSIPTRENTYGQRARDQGRSIDELGTAANSAVSDAVTYRQREAAARALAKAQAMQERNAEFMGGLGNVDYDFNATGKRGDVIKQGMKLLGQPYKWGGGHGGLRVGPVDCSGLVRYAFGKAGIKVPGVSQTQMTMGHKTKISKLLPGDLVGKGHPAHHIAIYLGNGKILEAQQTGTKVHIRSIKGDSSWWGVHLSY